MKWIQLLLLISIPCFSISQEYADIDTYAKSIKYSRDYKSVAKELASPYPTEKEKVRAIFTWIVHNIRYDVKQFETNKKNSKYKIEYSTDADLEQVLQERVQQKIETTLKKKRGVCQDYSWLFQAMLKEVGINSEFVSGYSRTNPSQMGRVPKNPQHAWSAAKVDGEWALFDLTWSTDMEKFGSEGFFMMPADEFLKSHYPSEEKWQLIDPPLSIEEWSNQLYWHKSYNRYPVERLTVNGESHKHYIIPYKSELSLTIALKAGQEVYALKNQGEKQVKLEKNGGEYTLDIASNRMRGRVMICILNDGKFAPLLEFKVQ